MIHYINIEYVDDHQCTHLYYYSSLGRNGFHCIKFLLDIGNILLIMNLGESHSMLSKLYQFNNLIELNVLLMSVQYFGVHYLIDYIILNTFRFILVGEKWSSTSKVLNIGRKYGQSSFTINTMWKGRKHEYSIRRHHYP